MRKYLLPKEGNFYKANLHSHSTLSDGRLTPEEMKQLYKSNGYSILAYTDHNVFTDFSCLSDDTFLILNGSEEDVKTPDSAKKCHVGFIALDASVSKRVDLSGLNREHTPEYICSMIKRGTDSGFFAVFNHPTWSMEEYTDYINFKGMHAMEIKNNGSVMLGYDEYNERVYDDLLRSGQRIFCIAADDNHNIPGRDDSLGGFTMIKAPALEYKAVADALAAGHFYAGEGPEIHELYMEGNVLHIKTGEAASIRFTTAIRSAKLVHSPDGVCEAEFEVTPEQKYVRVTVTDKQGKKAWTNAYFTDEILEETI